MNIVSKWKPGFGDSIPLFLLWVLLRLMNELNQTQPNPFVLFKKFKNRTFDVIRRAIELSYVTIMAKPLLTATTRNLTLVKPVSETAPKSLFWITTCLPVVWVCAMVGLLKMSLFISQSRLKEIRNALPVFFESVEGTEQGYRLYSHWEPLYASAPCALGTRAFPAHLWIRGELVVHIFVSLV